MNLDQNNFMKQGKYDVTPEVQLWIQTSINHSGYH